ncbi:MAG TPA: ADOP family duplicated permease [Luteitalea sp.]|nr:ADOP family duplicated permease [Luteitalea sp.]
MGWRRFFRRAWWDDERARELESYIDLETDDNIARGMSPDDARAAARRKLGNTGRIREEIYAMNTVTLLDWLRQDVRYAARVLRRNPGFTIAAVLTLAIGIGGVTVIYSALRNILLDPFPYANPERMVNVYVTNPETGERQHGGAMGQDEALDFLEQQTAFDGVVVSATDGGVMRTAGGSDIVTVTEMTANTFPYLAVQPLKGRVFTDADTFPGAPPVVVLDYTTWIEKFGGRDDVLGQVITVNDTTRTIIGVMPDRFGWQATSMWVPLALRRGATPPDERRFWYQASVKPGMSLVEASERMTALVRRRALAHPDEYPPQVRIDVLDLRYRVVGRFGNVLFTLLGAVVLLLLIACCNVANMLLARATTREREMTLRAALGGGRLRIMAHLLTESGLLALAGAIGGCGLAWWGIRAVAAILPPQGIAAEVQLRLVPEALIASLALAVFTTLVVGIVPAWNASRQDLVNGMKESGKGAGANAKHAWIRNSLVVVEVALSLVLLLGAGLLVRNFATLLTTNIGVDPAGLASVVPFHEQDTTPDTAQRHVYYSEAVARARTIPGVQGAALVSAWPYNGWRMEVNRPGVQSSLGSQGVMVTFCDDHYLGLVGLKPLRGRTFVAADISSAAHVAVISRKFAERYFGSDEPIGQSIQLPQLAKAPASLPDVSFAIVGIVEDVRNQGLQQVPSPGVYLPTTLTAVGNTPRHIVVRAAGDAAAVVPALERTVRAVDLNVAVLAGQTLERRLQRVFFAAPRFSLVILNTFAIVGLLLVAIGVYGVMAYAVARRSQEFAIRMALGATGGDVVRSVVRAGGLLLLTGIAVGTFASRATNRLVLSQVVAGSADTDSTVTAAAAVGVIVLVGLAACLIPARRAARTSPMQALRQD